MLFPGTRVRWTCVVVGLGAAVGWGAIPADGADTAEYRLKAAFIYRFSEFVEWPAAAWQPRERVELCVTRPNPFGTALQDILTGQRFNGRPLVVKEVGADTALDSCLLLFVPASATTSGRVLLARAAALPVLTVGEHDHFLDEGGMINLRVVDGRIRFDINLVAASRADLRLSSQLLRLAQSVRGGRP